MDYRALAELVMMSLFGLSALAVAVGFSVRAFLAPTLRDLFGRPPATPGERDLLDARLHRLEDRLESIERSLDRIAAASEFDRRLGGPEGS